MKQLSFTFLFFWAFSLSLFSQEKKQEQSNHTNGDISEVRMLRIEEHLTCPDDKHPHAIDLGLPSGTKWSCCNVGADKPESYGGYYAWGETEEKSDYTWETYKHCNGTYESLHNIGENICGTQYDVAHVKWGGTWQMPSIDQLEELFDKCKYEWTTVNGVEGCKFTSKKNDCSIFLPAARCRWNLDSAIPSNYGYYWLGVQEQPFTGNVYILSLDSVHTVESVNICIYGLSIRPVNNSGKKQLSQVKLDCPDNKHPHKIDLGLPSGTKWACCNVGADKPESYGDYFAWGETETKKNYSSETYKHCDGSNENFHDIGEDIGNTLLDVAHVKWGGTWQMPSLEQIKELLDNCSFEWTNFNGIKGRLFISNKNGVSLFLPASGIHTGTSFYDAGELGCYLSSTQFPESILHASGLLFDPSDVKVYGFFRDQGHSVRAVSNNNDGR